MDVTKVADNKHQLTPIKTGTVEMA